MSIRDDSSCRPELKLLPDDTLMAHVRDGNPDALAVLFDRYRRLVLSVAWHILRDRGEAEDLVQSVFLEILQSAAKFDASRGSAKSWILQYAYHRSFNRRKYLRLRGIPNNPDALNQVHEAATGWYDCSFEIVESKRFVEEALGHLNGKQRTILELAFYEGLSMREASERTGESFDTVRHHFYRAIGNLRSIVQNDTEERFTKDPQVRCSSLTAASIHQPRRQLSDVRIRRGASFNCSRPLPGGGRRSAKAVLAQA